MAQPNPFEKENWIEYGIGTLVFLVRFYARWRTVGFRNWKGDDYLAVVGLILWTLDMTILTMIGRLGTNLGVTPEQLAVMSPQEIARREMGGKWLFAGWNAYVTLIWTLKGCMLCFFNRITLGLKRQVIVKWTGVACVVTYLIMIAVIWGHCTPLSHNWQVSPIPSYSCVVKTNNYLAVAVLNITTDIAIVAIPVPLLWTVKLTQGRKIVIGALLCSGLFVMVASILRCIFTFQNVYAINTCTIWAIRETMVGIVAVNAACIKPLFSQSQWLKSENRKSNTTPGGTGDRHSYTPSTKTQFRNSMPRPMSRIGAHAFRPSEDTMVAYNKENRGTKSRNTSLCSEDPNRGYSSPTGIAVLREFHVSEERGDVETGMAQPQEKW